MFHRSKFRLRTVALGALLLLNAFTVQAQKSASVPPLRERETSEQFAARTQWWREARFGMFIHWGVYSVPADSSRGLAEWYMSNFQMQVPDYEKFAAQFNPVKFDAKQWVRIARNAGMKYIVITSKHHDGFAMFDSKVSDYSITKATPFKRDPMKELAAECKRQGVKLCFYHSIMDWHHPDYLPRRDWEKTTRPAGDAYLDRYIAYMKTQLKELVTNYGPLGVLWFDGEWENTWTHEHGKDLYNYVRSLQPSILINNRVDKGRAGMQGMTTDDKFMGDFGTPEQEIPARGFPDGRLWETCMTLNDTWGYARNDHNWKSADDLIRKLVDIASKGGNFLLNVGPTELGEFTPETIDRLEAMGRWMKVNGAAVYGTSSSPYRKLPFEGRCTRKGNRLYVHIFRWPAGELTLPGLKTNVLSARALDGGEKLAVSRSGDTVTIAKPAKLDPIATVLELRLAGPPEVEETVTLVRANPDGTYILSATDADIQGNAAKLEEKNGIPNIGYWTNGQDTVSWKLNVTRAGRYTVRVDYACAPGSDGSVYRIMVEGAGEGLSAQVESTGDWAQFAGRDLEGTLSLPVGQCTIRLVPQSVPRGAVMNLRSLLLKPAT